MGLEQDASSHSGPPQGTCPRSRPWGFASTSRTYYCSLPETHACANWPALSRRFFSLCNTNQPLKCIKPSFHIRLQSFARNFLALSGLVFKPLKNHEVFCFYSWSSIRVYFILFVCSPWILSHSLDQIQVLERYCIRIYL